MRNGECGIPINILSSLSKREAGRDFWEDAFKPLRNQ
jgi:hypothetical protein